MTDCTQTDIAAITGLVTTVLITINLIIGYFRHEHLKSDNKRLLHVIEAKTANVSDVK